jgi:antitoxin component YwqK of YwqJK toxin-antitoxin module
MNLELKIVFTQICIVVLTICPFKLSGQATEKIKTYVVNVTAKDSTIKAEIFYNNPSIRLKENRYYYWYKDNRIFCSEGDFDGKLLNGTYTCCYSDKNLKEKGRYEKGLRKGIWRRWYANGVTREVIHFKDGLRHGKYFLYSSGGQLVLEAFYKRGKLHGKYIQWSDGTIKQKSKFKNGAEVKKPGRKKKPMDKTKIQKDETEKKKGLKLPKRERPIGNARKVVVKKSK